MADEPSGVESYVPQGAESNAEDVEIAAGIEGAEGNGVDNVDAAGDVDTDDGADGASDVDTDADADNGADGASDADLDEDRPLDSMHLWLGDAGTLPFDARTALLRLVKGPYISETTDAVLWRALLNYTEPIRSRLADLFLELCIDAESGVAFAKNVSVDEGDFPKAATSYTMTLLDTIMVLLLRKELQTAGSSRVFVGQADLFLQMGQYRPLEKVDQAAFMKKLETSWGRLVKHRLVVKSDVEGRYEVSPVLKLVFGAEEARAVFEEYQQMKAKLQESEKPQDDDSAAEKGRTLFDGLE